MKFNDFNLAWALQQKICEMLNENSYVKETGLVFLEENRRDIENEMKISLQKQGLSCVCLTPDSTYIGHQGSHPVWEFVVELQFLEYVPVNRASNKKFYVSGLDMANFVSLLLCGPMASTFSDFCPVSIKQTELEDKLICTIFQFKVGCCGNRLIPSEPEFDWVKYTYNGIDLFPVTPPSEEGVYEFVPKIEGSIMKLTIVWVPSNPQLNRAIFVESEGHSYMHSIGKRFPEELVFGEGNIVLKRSIVMV